MKLNVKKNVLIRSALVLGLVVCSPVQAQPDSGKGMMKDKMTEYCQEIKVQKQQMMDASKAQDAALTEELEKMKRAPQDQKIDLIAAVVTLIAEQRISMNTQKAKMEDMMMKHMMRHMEMGKDSMMHCPMMMDMDKKPDEKKEDSSSKHHED